MVALSTAFCPPIEYFAVLAGYSSVFIDSSELYNKQSWRNRCRILSGSGPLDLMVPVVHASSRRITELRVEYTTPWIPKMERAISSAYDSSPFFEFYKDGLFAILESRQETLWDLNYCIIEWLCSKIGLADTPPSGVRPSGSPHHPFGTVPPLPHRGCDVPQGVCLPAAADGEGILDLREVIHPKRENTILRDLGLGRPYWQVFQDRFGFTPGLSVLDLLFNEGPDSILWLK